MEYLFWYFVLAIPCFFVRYCNRAGLNARMKSVTSDLGFWKFHKNFFSEGFRLLVHDYFGLYCPWSWERAKRYRLAHMREYLGLDGRDHEKLGHITAADCDNSEKQESIARHTYISRKKFWTDGMFQLLISPIPGLIIIIGALVLGVIELFGYLFGKRI